MEKIIGINPVIEVLKSDKNIEKDVLNNNVIQKVLSKKEELYKKHKDLLY